MSAHAWTVEWRTRRTREWKPLDGYWSKNYLDACYDLRKARLHAELEKLPYEYRVAKYMRVERDS